jgi:hypothetical protein
MEATLKRDRESFEQGVATLMSHLTTTLLEQDQAFEDTVSDAMNTQTDRVLELFQRNHDRLQESNKRLKQVTAEILQ